MEIKNILLCSIYLITSTFALLVTLRIFLQERKNPNTDVSYGLLAFLCFTSFVPVFSVIVAGLFIGVYYKHFQFPATAWVDKPVYQNNKTT